MRALNYLIKDIYEWIANIQGLGSSPTTAIVDHDHKSASLGGDYPMGDITASMITYLTALQADILVTNVCDKIDDEVISGKWSFTGGFLSKISTNNISNPPTEAELNTAFGAAATVGAGFIGIVNDAGGGTKEYLCWSDGTTWFYVAGIKTGTVFADQWIDSTS